MAGSSHAGVGWHFAVSRADLERMSLDSLLDMLRYDRATVVLLQDDIIVLQSSTTTLTDERWTSFDAPILARARVKDNRPYALAREARESLARRILEGGNRRHGHLSAVRRIPHDGAG